MSSRENSYSSLSSCRHPRNLVRDRIRSARSWRPSRLGWTIRHVAGQAEHRLGDVRDRLVLDQRVGAETLHVQVGMRALVHDVGLAVESLTSNPRPNSSLSIVAL